MLTDGIPSRILRFLRDSSRSFYLIKKIGSLLLTLWIVGTITFLIMHFLPGDPFTDEQALPPEILLDLRTHYGLEDSLFTEV